MLLISGEDHQSTILLFVEQKKFAQKLCLIIMFKTGKQFAIY